VRAGPPPGVARGWVTEATEARQDHALRRGRLHPLELAGELRDGRFGCAAVQAEKVLRVTALDDTHADVAYERKLTLRRSLTAIDTACGTVTRPPGEATVSFVKTDSTWGLASLAPAGDGGDGGAN